MVARSERQERVRQEMMDATVEMPDVSEMPSVRFSGLNALPSQASHTIVRLCRCWPFREGAKRKGNARLVYRLD